MKQPGKSAFATPRGSRRSFLTSVVGLVFSGHLLRRLFGGERATTTPRSDPPIPSRGDRSRLVYYRHHNDGEPVGSARLKPAYVIEDDGQRVVLSAACTHPDCGDIVSYDVASGTFHCSCGGRYVRTGRALAGPPSTPLAQFAARVVDDVA